VQYRKPLSVLLFTLLLFVGTPFASAQDEEAEGPTIPYFQTGIMNVPIPQDGWVDQSEGDVALFVNEDLSATIRIEPFDTLLVEEAIPMALEPLVDAELPEPTYEGRVALNTGNWYQQHYDIDDLSITAVSILKGDRTFVILFWEDSADYAVWHYILRTPLTEGSAEPDFAAAVEEAALALGGDDLVEEPSSTEEVVLVSGNWALFSYADGARLYAVEDDRSTYASLVRGDSNLDATQAVDGYFTVFEGFFTTPDNSEFLLLGLAFFTIAMGGLMISFWLRYRGARKDMALVEQLAEEE